MKRIIKLGSVAACLALSVAACGGDSGSEGESDGAQVAMVHIAVVDESSWDKAGAAAYDAMCEKNDFDCTRTESVTYEAAPGVLRDFGEAGYEMVILHSSGYASAVEEIAADYPETEFVLFSYAEDTKGLDNYSAWSMNWDQVGYAIGVLAGLSTETDHVAVVGGEKVPSSERAVAFIEHGVQHVNPDAETTPVWVGSWTDAAKAYELAKSVIESGADFIALQADLAASGAQRAAQESGVLSHGEYVDQAQDFPEAIVSSYLVDMAGAFDEIGTSLVDGKLDGQIVQMGVESGDLEFASPFMHVPADVEEQLNEVLAQIASGELELPAE